MGHYFVTMCISCLPSLPSIGNTQSSMVKYSSALAACPTSLTRAQVSLNMKNTSASNPSTIPTKGMLHHAEIPSP